MNNKFITVTILSIILVGCMTQAHKLTPGQQASIAEANPEMRRVLNELNKLEPMPIDKLSIDDAREQPSMTDAVEKVMEEKGISTDPIELADVDDRNIKINDRIIPVRIYTPEGKAPFPVVVYAHGGGWVLANLDTYDASCRALSKMTKAIVISVDYAKAPEYKFPTAHEDVYSTLEWTYENARSVGGDPNNVAVAGESVGGNMAAGVVLMAKDRGIRLPVHQLLIYPVISNDLESPSYKQYSDALQLNRAMMAWFFDKYAGEVSDMDNKYFFPIKASYEDLSGLPPTTIITAQIDPLMSEGQMYADKLKAAGNDVLYQNFEGVTHEFFGAAKVIKEAKLAEELAAARLNVSFKLRPHVLTKSF